jgi:hypothetical protein
LPRPRKAVRCVRQPASDASRPGHVEPSDNRSAEATQETEMIRHAPVA